MTKAEIKDKIFMLKEYAKGKKNYSNRLVEDINDYYFGNARAYEDIEERLEALLEKIQENS